MEFTRKRSSELIVLIASRENNSVVTKLIKKKSLDEFTHCSAKVELNVHRFRQI